MFVKVRSALSVATATMVLAASAHAQTAVPPLPASKAPSSIVTGAANVSVEGKAAAREGDQTTAASTVAEGSSTVRINGKPVARAGDKTKCGGVIVGGSSTVFINGKPMATSGSTVSGCQ